VLVQRCLLKAGPINRLLSLQHPEILRENRIMKTKIIAAILLSLFVMSDASALSEAQKRQYREQHEQDYQNGTMQHHVPLEEMKKRKEQMFANNPAVRDCIEKAASPPEVGACIQAGTGGQAPY
jgi:hypothetical protein